jgi:hypothetical protein
VDARADPSTAALAERLTPDDARGAWATAAVGALSIRDVSVGDPPKRALSAQPSAAEPARAECRSRTLRRYAQRLAPRGLGPDMLMAPPRIARREPCRATRASSPHVPPVRLLPAIRRRAAARHLPALC